MKNYLSLIKFSHTIFALPFALIGFSLGIAKYPDAFSYQLLLLVLACMVFARSAAMAFNRYIDKDIDLINPRTANRELPAGILASNHVIYFVIFNAVAFVFCAGLINGTCLVLSPIALIIILGYSLTKRFTALCHFVLGLGLSLAPIGAYLAVTETFDIVPIFFGMVVFFWVAGFDIIYALQDESFDVDNNLKSTPALLGKEKAMMVSSGAHFLSISFLIAAGFLVGVEVSSLSFIYWVGILIFCALMVYQHRIVSARDLSKINLAFFTTNGIASVVFATLFIIDMMV